MFATGFSMNVAAITDSASRETENFLARTAAQHKIFVLGGTVNSDSDGRGRNECVVFSPEGIEVARYCKLHPFTLGGEAQHYAAGSKVQIFRVAQFTVAPFICYDLRFPEIFRAAVRRGANLFTVIDNWPSTRIDHWTTHAQSARYRESSLRRRRQSLRRRSGTFRTRAVASYSITRARRLPKAGAREGTISADLDVQELTIQAGIPFLMTSVMINTGGTMTFPR